MGRKNDPWVTAGLLLIWVTSVHAENVPGFRIALPAECSVKLRWVCPPFNQENLRQAKWYEYYNWYDNFSFSVDASGQPWFAVPDRYNTKGLVLNPARQYRFGLSHPFRGMVCLDNGALLFHTNHDVGYISSPDAPAVREGAVVLPFQPALTLPLADCRLYAGADNALYIVGPGRNGDNEVYLLQPEPTSQGDRKLLRNFRKVFTSPEPIGPVTGDGRVTFVSLGRTITKIVRDGQTPPEIIVHPSDDIKQLAYSPDAGLFYATEYAIGLAGERGMWDFLGLNYARIALRNESLYVCVWDTLAVFALDRVADLARYAPHGTYIPQAQPTSPVEVTAIEFRAFPPDPNAEPTYGEEFERSGIRRVDGVIRLHPAGPQTARTTLTVQWSGPKDLREDGVVRWGRITHRVLDFSNGKDKRWWFSAPFAETFYPGTYTLRVLLDGIEKGVASFTITGETTPREAALQDDIQLLSTLLEQGADPDAGNGATGTALHTAAFHGSTAAARLLLEHGAQVNAKDSGARTPLFYSAMGYSQNPTGALETARLLIQHGADVSATDNDSFSVLVRAFNSYHPGVENLLDLLLEHGADANARGYESQTPLAWLAFVHCSYPQGKAKMAECLIRHGADINATDNDGRSVFRRIAGGDDADLVQVLLAHGANPDRPDINQDNYKTFPLVHVRPAESRILQLLLAHGANPNVEDFPGYTPLSRAIEDVEPDSVRLLLEYGASLTADCLVHGHKGSPLRGALSSYLEYAPKDRVKAQKAKDIFFTLLQRGARLRAQEEAIVANKRLHGWLPRDVLLDVLKRNDRAVLEARDVANRRIQSVVITRLLEMAKAKAEAATSSEGFSAALALCDQAKTRAQVWNIEAQCPLIYYNTGLLYGQLGELAAARDNFKRYLDLAPNTPEAQHVRQLLLN